MTNSNNNRQCLRVRIVNTIDNHENDSSKDSSRLEFVCSVKDNAVEEIFSYNNILQHLGEEEEDQDIIWKFRHIATHEGLLKPSNLSYNGSICSFMVE